MDQTDAAASAWMAALAVYAKATPGSSYREGLHDTFEIITGLPIPTLNGAISTARVPDVEELATFAAAMASGGLPWSLQVRANQPDPRIVELAASHGLDQRLTLPFMIKALTEQDLNVPETEPVRVRRISADARELYQDLLAAGFESPREVFAGFSAPAVLDHPQIPTYIAEADGTPVATGLGILVDDEVGVFNISVPPEHRRRGYGTLVTAAVLRDGYAAGARTAFLHASPLGRPVYESMGFHVAEEWTIFSS
jgi:N-acetylglutamate synthase